MNGKQIKQQVNFGYGIWESVVDSTGCTLNGNEITLELRFVKWKSTNKHILTHDYTLRKWIKYTERIT